MRSAAITLALVAAFALYVLGGALVVLGVVVALALVLFLPIADGDA